MSCWHSPRGLWSFGLLFCLSCGGAIRSGDTGAVDAGTGGVGGAHTGTGGSSGGGVAGNAGTAGSAGSGGSGGLADICRLPRDSGPCEAATRAYWHNPAAGVCEPFYYGGCQGNANRFETLAACQAACHGGTPDYDACTRPSDCTLTPVNCCGGCEPAIAQTYVAINQTHVADFSTLKRCETVDCAACMEVPAIDRTMQYFVATCVSGQCAMVDIRETELISCNYSAECKLRMGATCCERCSSDSLVALSTSAKLGDLVCGSDAPACPPCAPMIPPGYQAQCQIGKCRVTTAPVR